MLQNKNFVMQGGVRNYLGKTEEVKKAPKYWQSSPDSPKTELSYITDAEKELLLKANLHGSLINQQPNVGASGILSFDGWGDASDGFGSSSSSSSSGDSGGYDTSYTYQPTTSQLDLSLSSTGSYDEPGALSQPSTVTATDPGLAGEDAVTWSVDKDGNISVKSTPDSITDYGQNLQSEFQSQIKQSGIKGLMKLISDEAPDAIKERELESYTGRKVAVDASMAIYQFLIAVRSGGEGIPSTQLTNDAGEVTSHIQGMFNRTIRMLSSGIKPVFVFDGKPPTMKSGELAIRRQKEKKLLKI